MINPKIYTYIGFAAKARKCLGGYQGVEGAIRSNKAKIVICDTELGVNTREKLDRLCANAKVPILYIDNPGRAAGKYNNMCLAITDAGLADAIGKVVSDAGGNNDGKDR